MTALILSEFVPRSRAEKAEQDAASWRSTILGHNPNEEAEFLRLAIRAMLLRMSGEAQRNALHAAVKGAMEPWLRDMDGWEGEHMLSILSALTQHTDPVEGTLAMLDEWVQERL